MSVKGSNGNDPAPLEHLEALAPSLRQVTAGRIRLGDLTRLRLHILELRCFELHFARFLVLDTSRQMSNLEQVDQGSTLLQDRLGCF